MCHSQFIIHYTLYNGIKRCILSFQWWRTQSEEGFTAYRLECGDEEFIEKMLKPTGLWRIEELWKDGQLEQVRMLDSNASSGSHCLRLFFTG